MDSPEADQAGFERHDTRAAVADDVARHALQHLERHLRLEQHRVVVVGVHVDEAGGDGQAGRVDLLRARRGNLADGDDPIPAHADVGASAGRAGAVVHRPAADDEVHDGYLVVGCAVRPITRPTCGGRGSASWAAWIAASRARISGAMGALRRVSAATCSDISSLVEAR